MSENTNGHVNFTVQDIALMGEIIKVVTARGALKPEELTPIGNLYSKISSFLQQQQEYAKALNSEPSQGGN